MGILEGSKRITPQGRYESVFPRKGLGDPPTIESDEKLTQKASEMTANIAGIMKSAQATSDNTAVTKGINEGKNAYADMLLDASKADPDEALSILEEGEKEYIERLDGYKENVRAEIKEGLAITSGNTRRELLKHTLTALSKRDDAALTELGDTIFGHAAAVITDEEASMGNVVAAQGAYLEALQQTILPEYLKRVVTQENKAGKWRTKEQAEGAFNTYAAGQLTELVELLIDRDDSALDSSIEEILYGDKITGKHFLLDHGKDPSGLIKKYKDMKANRLVKGAGSRGRAMVASLSYSTHPVHGDNWTASVPEIAGGLSDLKEELDGDPHQNYDVKAKNSVNSVLEAAKNNMGNFDGIDDAIKFINQLEKHEIYEGVDVAESFDGIRKEIKQEYVNQTIDRKNKIVGSITEVLGDPDVILTEDMIIELIDDATEGSPGGVRIVDGQIVEMTPNEEAVYYVEEAFRLSSTHTTGAADGVEFNALDSFIKSKKITSDSIERSRNIEASRIKRGFDDREYLYKVLSGEDEMPIVNHASLTRSVNSAITPEEQTAMIDGIVAAGPGYLIPEIKEHYERVFDENPAAGIGLITKWSESNPLSVTAMYGDRYDDRPDGTWDLFRYVLEGAIDNTSQNQRLAAELATRPEQAGQIVDNANSMAKFFTHNFSAEELAELNPDGWVYQMLSGTVETIRKNAAEGMSIPYIKDQPMSDDDAAIAAISVALGIQKRGLSTDDEIKAYLNSPEFITDLKELDAPNGVVIESALVNKDVDVRVPNMAVNRKVGGVPIYNQAQKDAIKTIDTKVLATAIDYTGGGTEAHMGFSGAFAISSEEASGYGFLSGDHDYLVVPIINVKESGLTAEMGYAIYELTESGEIRPVEGEGLEDGMVIRHTERHELGSEEDRAQVAILSNLRLASQHYSLGRTPRGRPKGVTIDDTGILIMEMMRLTN